MSKTGKFKNLHGRVLGAIDSKRSVFVSIGLDLQGEELIDIRSALTPSQGFTMNATACRILIRLLKEALAELDRVTGK